MTTREYVAGVVRAALYGRKSTSQEKASEEARSVARQITLGREFAEQQGWRVDERNVFTDDGISGGIFDPKHAPGSTLYSGRQSPGRVRSTCW